MMLVFLFKWSIQVTWLADLNNVQNNNSNSHSHKKSSIRESVLLLMCNALQINVQSASFSRSSAVLLQHYLRAEPYSK